MPPKRRHYFDTATELAKFKAALARQTSASDSEEESIDEHHNWYNKLKRRSQHVHRGKLADARSIVYDRMTVQYVGHKRRIIHQYASARDEESDEATADAGAEKADESNDSDTSDPYADVNIADLLAPVSSPADVLKHASYSQLFTRPTISILKNQALSAISMEHDYFTQLQQFLVALLGSNPNDLIVDMDTARRAEEAKAETNGDPADTDAPTPVRRVTRTMASSQADGSKEFMRDDFDPNFGTTPSEALEMKKFLQAALDRSGEFLRCLQRIRSCFIKSELMLRKVEGWCADYSMLVERQKAAEAEADEAEADE